MIADVYKIARGLDPAVPSRWLVIHAVVICSTPSEMGRNAAATATHKAMGGRPQEPMVESGMDELRVPKHTIRVEMRFAGGGTAEVEVFLANLGGGRERLSDLLEGEAEFVPARIAGSDTTLLCRSSIAVARVEGSAETSGPAPLTTPTEKPVTVHLADGTEVKGTVRYVLAGESSRLLDHLNEPTRFFAVWSGGTVALVAKAHVTRVVPA